MCSQNHNRTNTTYTHTHTHHNRYDQDKENGSKKKKKPENQHYENQFMKLLDCSSENTKHTSKTGVKRKSETPFTLSKKLKKSKKKRKKKKPENQHHENPFMKLLDCNSENTKHTSKTGVKRKSETPFTLSKKLKKSK